MIWVEMGMFIMMMVMVVVTLYRQKCDVIYQLSLGALHRDKNY